MREEVWKMSGRKKRRNSEVENEQNGVSMS